LENIEEAAFLGGVGPWKKLQVRGYYILIVAQYRSELQKITTFQSNITEYIANNYDIIPTMEKQKIWKTKNGVLHFHEI
jgi:hypothetical protein